MIIRNIWAVGQNYSAHNKEMGYSANTEPAAEPIIFLKAGSCASVNSPVIQLPAWTENVHHEVELALKFNGQLKVNEAAVALDLTERSVQAQAKQSGHPWTLAKSFKEACALSAFFAVRDSKILADLELKLWLNEELRQFGNTRQMLTPIDDLIAYVLDRFPVCPGDILLTGTPAGVGPIMRGDKLRAQIPNHITHVWQVE